MLIVISPAKKLDFENQMALPTSKTEDLLFSKKTQTLISELKLKKCSDIQKMMKLSDNLALLNYDRFKSFNSQKVKDNATFALFAFVGDTYVGLDAKSMSQACLKRSFSGLRILSGLYGILRPFDKIRPYRLEMGTKFSFLDFKNLYQFWHTDLTAAINQDMAKFKHKVLVNLASVEYFKAVDTTKLTTPIINVKFLEVKNKHAKVVGLFSKRARGMMARFILDNNLKNSIDLKAFNQDGYKFVQSLSCDKEFVFQRTHPE